MKVIIGTHNTIPNKDKYKIYNLNSFIEGYEPLRIIPNMNYYNITDIEYDKVMTNYIFNNDVIFFEFMKLIISLHNGEDVYIIIGQETRFVEYFQTLLLKRYGISSCIIDNYDDLEYINETYFPSNKVMILDKDKERYLKILMDTNPNTAIRIANEGI